MAKEYPRHRIAHQTCLGKKPMWRMARYSGLGLIGFLLLLSACATSPITGRRQLMLVGEAEEQKLGLAAYNQVLQKEPISRDPIGTEPVQRIVKRLAAVADRPDFRWQVNVIKNDKTVNAFVLPGGKIAVYTGIFPIAQTEAGLAIILGHEVGHAIARHGAERMSQNRLVQWGGQVLGSALQGNPQGNLAMAAYGLGTKVGVLLPYSRSHETEADRIGLVLAAKAGYDPRVALMCGNGWRSCPAVVPRSSSPRIQTRRLVSQTLSNISLRH